jgi:dipeptidyl aminopeptidase/acylaminoacyl peptidase
MSTLTRLLTSRNSELTLLTLCALAWGLDGSLIRAIEPTPKDTLARYAPTASELQESYQRSQQANRPGGKVYKAQIIPHWFHDNLRFWYRNDVRGSRKEFILVDVERGARQPAFDHQKLAEALSKATGKSYQAQALPFDSIEFVDGDQTIQFQVEGTTWKCDSKSYECSRMKMAAVPSKGNDEDRIAEFQNREEERIRESIGLSDVESLSPEVDPAPQNQSRRQRDQTPSSKSPDGKWTAFIKDSNVYLRSSDDMKETGLSQDGKPGLAYGLLHWAPDSKTLVAFRIDPAETKDVYLIESSPKGGGRAKLRTRPYALPGDKFTAYELNLFDVANKKQIKPEVDRVDYDFPQLHWSRDGRHFSYQKVDRGHQRFRVIKVDSQTGNAMNVIDENSKTFIWTAHAEMLRLQFVNYLDATDEIIYVSERDGWRHLYLIDAKEGKVKNQITKGEYLVRGIERIDADMRQIWFQACGKNPAQDPYFIHHYRVNFDGSGLVPITEGDGNHTVQYSPDRKYVIDTYSRVDMAPVHELRQTSDGKLQCKLEDADISELSEADWRPPEVFVAKGRDGKTDIWGIIVRPSHFDPNKKYPVIEQIYAGPQGSFVPKSFIANSRFAALAELGFIVVQIDAMGTANRSKAFHDVCWHNLKDAGFSDRILWHQAVAKKYPYYDLDRVGIYGGSAGGQNATAAVLFHPEFYKAAVSGCGCHDNRMDKASWNEQWMGYPVGPQYADCSNIDNAFRLRGKLLLIVGELDNNVPPESTFRLVDALIKAGKDFEFIFVPGAGHGMGGTYGVRRMHDFFVRHLHGVEPPDRNGSSSEQPASRGASAPGVTVIPPPESFFAKVREKDRDEARKFYKKYLDIKGLPVVASAYVADQALLRTHELVTHLLAGRPDILEAMIKNGTRLIIIGKDQVYTDMPEYRNHPNPVYQNERVRGTGGFDVTSFGEENLLNLPLDRYDDESIAVHEFCHTIDSALGRIDPTWRSRLVQTYKTALSQGLWKNAYAASNPAEYWAEICQSYFDCNRINNWNHAAIANREQLKMYDPDGYELVKSTFKLTPASDWRYTPLQHQPSVIPPPAKFKFDPYYTKFTSAREFPVLGSNRVSDEALLRANDIIRKMFAYRHDILKAMIADGARLVVLGRQEKLSDLPEFKAAKDQPGFDEVRFYNSPLFPNSPREPSGAGLSGPARLAGPTKREEEAEGDGVKAQVAFMVVPEENVLCELGDTSDPFAGECMVICVMAKGLYQVTALRPTDPEFDKRRGKQQYELRVKRLDVEFDHALEKKFEAAMSKGLWRGTPAAQNRAEYWAAGVLAYFDAAGQGLPPQLADRPITTREALKVYDPDLYDLVDETFAYKEHVDWRFTKPESPRP